LNVFLDIDSSALLKLSLISFAQRKRALISQYPAAGKKSAP
jgi:hypothetical protein